MCLLRWIVSGLHVADDARSRRHWRHLLASEDVRDALAVVAYEEHRQKRVNDRYPRKDACRRRYHQLQAFDAEDDD